MKINNSHRVTIITPSFNQALFLEQTILSVVNQDYEQIEYIVIDGASSDGSVDIIRKHEVSIAYWISEPDNGQVEALDKGIAHSSGDILCWLNSDDIYLSKKVISRVVELFCMYPDVGIITGGGAIIDQSGKWIRMVKVVPSSINYRNLRYRNQILQPSTFVRRGLVVSTGLDPSLNFTFDWDFWIRLTKEYNIMAIDEAWAGYRLWGKNKTSSGSSRRTYDQAEVIKRHLGKHSWQFFIMRGFYLIYRLAEHLPQGGERILKSITHRISSVISALSRDHIPVA